MSTSTMPALSAPSKAAATSLLLTENWLRNAFISELHTVTARKQSEGHPLSAVVVTLANPATEAEQVPLMIVEVSDAPASEYPGEEAGRHAAAGVRDYWVIEAGARKLHVHRDPRPDPDAKYGASYKQVRTYGPNALVAPLAAEIHLAQVINLLPW